MKVAVVGAGAMAREHLKAFAALSEVQLVGIASRTRARAEALARDFAIGVVADSPEELATRTGAELVVVTASVTSMFEVARECFAQPWHVLLEKPPAATLSQAEELLALPRRGRVLVGLNRRYYAATRAVVADLENDPGSRFIVVLDQQEPARLRAAGLEQSFTDTLRYSNSIHLVDYLRVLGRGAVKEVRNVFPFDSELVVAAVLFDSGDRGLYQAVWDRPGPWSVTVTTPSVRWEMRPLESALRQAAGQRTAIPVEPDPLDLDFKAGFRRQAEDVVAGLSGRPTRAATLEDAVETMRLIERLYRT